MVTDCRRLARLLLLALALGLGCGAKPSDTASATVMSISAAQTREDGLMLPNAPTSIKLAVIGDSGRGTPPQHEIGAQMSRLRQQFPFELVLMLGDNIYEGPASPEDYRRKFEEPYRDLLQSGVRFSAVLGNHDDPRQVLYPPFGMQGQRYYTFTVNSTLPVPRSEEEVAVEFFALDSTNLDRAQVRWLGARLAESRASWKIALLHHPLYTSGRYRNAARAHRWALEPLFDRHDVAAAFSGHEHIYQRSELQKEVLYFVSGGAGSLRLGDGVPAPYIARTYDADYHFMLVEIEREALHFQAIARTGATVDAGSLRRSPLPP